MKSSYLILGAGILGAVALYEYFSSSSGGSGYSGVATIPPSGAGTSKGVASLSGSTTKKSGSLLSVATGGSFKNSNVTSSGNGSYTISNTSGATPETINTANNPNALTGVSGYISGSTYNPSLASSSVINAVTKAGNSLESGAYASSSVSSYKAAQSAYNNAQSAVAANYLAAVAGGNTAAQSQIENNYLSAQGTSVPSGASVVTSVPSGVTAATPSTAKYVYVDSAGNTYYYK
jgi:hypothetical protein